jgi:poly(A) polymerase Pap1
MSNKPLFSAISTRAPTQRQEASTNALEKLLRDTFHLYESDEGMKKREGVLAGLNTIVKAWVLSVAEQKVLATSDTRLHCIFLKYETITQEAKIK